MSIINYLHLFKNIFILDYDENIFYLKIIAFSLT